ncbi:hypothetical protein CLU79DRAFT_734429 [Phycomyces nitens]|nr:hypothetical protein CLU79DRAFT_734429 [Phycomyces nitens]
MRYSENHQASARLLLIGSVLLTAYCAAAIQTTELVGPISQPTGGIMCIQRVCPTLDTGVDGSEECPTECSDSCYRDDDPCCPGNYVMTCNTTSSSSSSSGKPVSKTSSIPSQSSVSSVATPISSAISSSKITGVSGSLPSSPLSSGAPSSQPSASGSVTGAANHVVIRPFILLSLSLILSMKLIL